MKRWDDDIKIDINTGHRKCRIDMSWNDLEETYFQQRAEEKLRFMKKKE